jgi:cobalt-zinc-cadmium resistance protein CzcA
MKIIWLNNKQLNVLGTTAVLFPTVYGAQKKVYETKYEKKKASYEIKKQSVIRNIKVYIVLFTKPRIIFLFG